jgi:hypothetical protein
MKSRIAFPSTVPPGKLRENSVILPLTHLKGVRFAARKTRLMKRVEAIDKVIAKLNKTNVTN